MYNVYITNNYAVRVWTNVHVVYEVCAQCGEGMNILFKPTFCTLLRDQKNQVT